MSPSGVIPPDSVLRGVGMGFSVYTDLQLKMTPLNPVSPRCGVNQAPTAAMNTSISSKRAFSFSGPVQDLAAGICCKEEGLPPVKMVILPIFSAGTK